MILRCKENLEVIIEHHPHFESLNKQILEDASAFEFQRGLKNADGGESNVKAVKANACYANFEEGKYLRKKVIYSKSLDLLGEWVLKIIKRQYNLQLVLLDSWVSRYFENDYTVSHSHGPIAFTSVYFVKCPKGSSPLVFTTSKKRIKAEEGNLLVFPGNLLHHVNKNICDDRVVWVGNFAPHVVI